MAAKVLKADSKIEILPQENIKIQQKEGEGDLVGEMDEKLKLDPGIEEEKEEKQKKILVIRNQ